MNPERWKQIDALLSALVRKHGAGSLPHPQRRARTRQKQWALQDSNLGPIGYERGNCSIH